MFIKKIRRSSISSLFSLILVVFFLNLTLFGCGGDSGGDSSNSNDQQKITMDYVSGMTDYEGRVKLESGDFSVIVDAYEQDSTESLEGALVQVFPLEDGALVFVSDPDGGYYPGVKFVKWEEFDQASGLAVITILTVGLAVVTVGLVAYDYFSEPEEFPVQFVEVIENDEKVKKLCFQVDLQDIFNTISVATSGYSLGASWAVKGAPAAIRGVTAINLGFTKVHLAKETAMTFTTWAAGFLPLWKDDFIDTCSYYYTNDEGEEIQIPYVSSMFPAKEGSTTGDFPSYTPDPNDTQELSIVQTIPPNNSIDMDPNTSISIFFDDEINPSTLNDLSIQVTDSSGAPIYGDYSGVLSTYGNTILNFQPKNILPSWDEITVTLIKDSGLEDDGGNNLTAVYSFSFQTGQEVGSPADLGFELGETGWIFSGDGAIVSSPPMENIFPTEGNYMAGISTGDVFGGTPLQNTTSVLSSGPIDVPSGNNYISFDYDFISQEFDEWVDSKYDDVFKVSITGPLASNNEIVTSVNIIGVDDSFPVNFGGLSDADETGWIQKTINISSLGSPITISFTVSDVGDEAYSSVVLIDNINFE